MHTRIDALPLPATSSTSSTSSTSATPDKDAESLKLQRVSEEFESLLLHEMIKSMRAADALLTDSEDGGSQNLHREMLDEQLARNMARGGGLGLARILEQQMQRRIGEGTP